MSEARMLSYPDGNVIETRFYHFDKTSFQSATYEVSSLKFVNFSLFSFQVVVVLTRHQKVHSIRHIIPIPNIFPKRIVYTLFQYQKKTNKL